MPSYVARVKVFEHGPQALSSLGSAKSDVLAVIRRTHSEITDDGKITADAAPKKVKLPNEVRDAVLNAFDLDGTKTKYKKGLYVDFDKVKGGLRKTARKASRRRRTTRRR